MNEEKTYVEDVDRSIYDFKDDEKDAFKLSAGLTPAIVEQISREKHDPAWMQLFRLQSLQIYQNMRVPDWGPSIEGLNMDNIVTYVRPNTGMKAKWSDVPEDIKNTFERLGIPQAERKSLAGVGAQYDSELVYHNVREESRRTGRRLHRHGKRADRPICQHGEKTLHEAGQAYGSQVCRAARRGLVGRLVCVCAQGREGGNPAAKLFPPECAGRGPV